MCRVNKAPVPTYQPNLSMCHDKIYDTKIYCSIIDIVLSIGNHVFFRKDNINININNNAI